MEQFTKEYKNSLLQLVNGETILDMDKECRKGKCLLTSFVDVCRKLVQEGINDKGYSLGSSRLFYLAYSNQNHAYTLGVSCFHPARLQGYTNAVNTIEDVIHYSIKDNPKKHILALAISASDLLLSEDPTANSKETIEFISGHTGVPPADFPKSVVTQPGLCVMGSFICSGDHSGVYCKLPERFSEVEDYDWEWSDHRAPDHVSAAAKGFCDGMLISYAIQTIKTLEEVREEIEAEHEACFCGECSKESEFPGIDLDIRITTSTPEKLPPEMAMRLGVFRRALTAPTIRPIKGGLPKILLKQN